MKKTFALFLIRQGHQPLDFTVSQLVFPAHNGYLGVMAGRQPLLSIMSAGLVRAINDSGQELIFGITGGFAEVNADRVKLLCDNLVEVKELDHQDLKTAKDKFYHQDCSQMNEAQKLAYLKLLMANRLHKQSAAGNSLINTGE